MIYIHIYIVFIILNMRIYKYIDMNDYFIHNILRREECKKIPRIDDYINVVLVLKILIEYDDTLAGE